MGNSELAPGSLFANRFEVQRAAAGGGMGTVYRATDRYSGQTVALKLLHSGGDWLGEAERFSREAQFLAELRHPGIVAHVAHGQTPDGRRFLAMEWLDGQDLGQRLEQGPLPVGDCVRLLEQVSDALCVAHKRGIIHRDLKPSNLFLIGNDFSRVKILDFGIARRIGAGKAMTRTGVVVGTPAYMAPEQARGIRDLTPATDVFSLGCVLYECLTGTPPFVADHIAAVLVRILFEEPVPIEQRRPGVPKSVSALLNRLLIKDPALRVASAEALRAELLSLGEFTEPAPAVTIAGPVPKAESLADQEQSLLSVVLAAPDGAGLELGATQTHGGSQLGAVSRQALLHALAALGSAPDFLANGTLVVTVPPLGSAQDQAALAARAALLIKERWADAVVSMATGRGAVHGRTAVGEVVELAARSLSGRMQDSVGTSVSGVRIDPLSAKLLEGRFVQTPRLGGALLLQEAQDADASRLLLGKPTPCVGRETELAMLEMHLQGCIEESAARAVLVLAPPGVGKSRLRHEFLRRAEKRNEEAVFLLGRGDMISAGAPYGILATAIRRLCGFTARDPMEDQQQRLRARIGKQVRAADQERVIHFVGEICGVASADAGNPLVLAARRDPRIMNDQISLAFLDFLRAECAVQPLLLVLEDLHWGDAMTVQLLDTALRELSAQPLLVLALARPEITQQFPSLWTHHVQQISLRPLGKKACERLVQLVLGKELTTATVGHLVERSAGNALYLEELIRAVASGEEQDLPETVLAMLQARVSRLDPEARRVLRAASVFGERFPLGGVNALFQEGRAGTELKSVLDSLVHDEILEQHRENRSATEPEYRFRHALMRDAAYGLLTEENRVAAHRLAGAYLERAGGVESAVLAEHARKGQDVERAARFFTDAAKKALGSYDLDATERYALRAIDCGIEGAALGTVRAMLAWGAFLRMDMATGYSHALAAVNLLRPGSYFWFKALAICFYSFFMINRFEEIGRLIGLFMTTDPEPDASLAGMEAGNALIVFFGNVGKRHDAALAIEKMRLMAKGQDPYATSLLLSVDCWRIAVLEADPYQPIKDAHDATELLVRNGDRFYQAAVLFALGVAYTAIGAFAAGEEALRSGMAISVAIGNLFWTASIHVHLGANLASQLSHAKQEEAIAISKAYLDQVELGPAMRGASHRVLGQVLMAQGDFPAAVAAFKTAADAFSAMLPYRLSVVALHAEALLQQGRVTEARALAEEGLQRIEEQGCLGYCEVPVRLAVTLARFADGDSDGGRKALADSLAQVRLRAAKILDPELKQKYLELPENRRIFELAQTHEQN